MPQLRRIWFAMLTQDSTDTGTDSRIALSINDAQLNFRDTSQDDQERGKANLYETNVTPANINTDDLNNSAIRVLILGAEPMGAATLHVWGETVDGAIFPLAAETDITKRLSTDPDEGNALLPLRTVGQGVEAAFTRLLFMMTTVDGDDPFVNFPTPERTMRSTSPCATVTAFRSSISTSRTLPSTNKNPGRQTCTSYPPSLRSPATTSAASVSASPGRTRGGRTACSSSVSTDPHKAPSDPHFLRRWSISPTGRLVI